MGLGGFGGFGGCGRGGNGGVGWAVIVIEQHARRQTMISSFMVKERETIAKSANTQ